MAAVTDLTWSQLNTALKQLLGTTNDVITIDGYGIPTDININAIASVGDNGTGVIKFMTRLFDAARVAQETANTGKTTGEKLSTFAAPTNAAPSNNLVSITRTIVSRADLTSATKIVGTNV